MCGIAGIVSLSGRPVAQGRVEAATHALAHRGPDDHGFWYAPDGTVALGQRRLAIIDLSPLGHQPMASGSGRYVSVYNGEIYNFAELRRELIGLGHAFRGGSDTEVMLAGFDQWGVEATLPRLAGMFALAVWDRQERTVWMARDRLGIKPLYWGIHDGDLVFGSELRVFQAAFGRLPLDQVALAGYLRFGYVGGPRSVLEGVGKLEPGCLVELRPGAEPLVRRWWSLAAVAQAGLSDPFRGSEAEAEEELQALLTRVVGDHLVSDVPLGTLLSGGVDSSTVTALMQKAGGGPVHSFAIGFEDPAWNEANHARAVAEHLGTRHTELMVSEADARAVIPALPDIYDEPFADISQIPTFLVSRLARRDVTVALSGDGGDETFGGYERYRVIGDWWRRISGVPIGLRRAAGLGLSVVPGALADGVADGLRPALGSRVPHLLSQRLSKMSAVLRSSDLGELYRAVPEQWPAPQPLLSRARPDADAPMPLPGADPVLRQMCEDGRTYLVDDILTKLDRASMAVGLETRPPLLDHRVVAFAWRLPLAFKVDASGGKRILRRVLARLVPPRLTERPKQGFGMPVGDWLRGPLRGWAEDLMADGRGLADPVLDMRAVERVWRAHLAGADRSSALWSVLMLIAWQKRYGAGAGQVSAAGIDKARRAG